jgi:hypothetical protein
MHTQLEVHAPEARQDSDRTQAGREQRVSVLLTWRCDAPNTTSSLLSSSFRNSWPSCREQQHTLQRLHRLQLQARHAFEGMQACMQSNTQSAYTRLCV